MICLASLALVVEVAVDLDLDQCISTKALNTWVHFAFCEVFDIQGSTLGLGEIGLKDQNFKIETCTLGFP